MKGPLIRRRLTAACSAVFCLLLLAQETAAAPGKNLVNPYSKISEIPAPSGFSRVPYPPGSYMSWLRNLPLLEDSRILMYDGREVQRRGYRIFAVIDMPLLFTSDLEQCADYGMRFWAEYHRASGLLDRLYLFDYGGSRQYFKAGGQSFEAFLKNAFAFSNSFSLLKGCTPVKTGEERPGDMFVQNETGGIGHVSMIVDACENGAGQKLFLVGFSYMPAQEFHIEKAGDEYGTGGWFTLEGYRKFLGDFYDYGSPRMRRF